MFQKGSNSGGGGQANVIRLKPLMFLHVLDNNTNVTRVEVGPQTFTRQDHEHVMLGPEMMVCVPPRSYCVISNPVVRDESGKPVRDELGQYKLRHGDQEIRLNRERELEPFPLYPGESVAESVKQLQIVPENVALRLRAVRDVDDRVAGDEWLFKGPGTYIPRVEVKVVETIHATVLGTNQALKIRARRECSDHKGKARKAGEEWLIREEGSYLPSVDEEIVETVDAVILTDKTALHLRAVRTFTDCFGKERRAGEEWLVTIKDSETHIPDVYEEVVGEVPITVLDSRSYCVVVDPVDERGKPQLGQLQVRKGECSFFLNPGERLQRGIQPVYVLSEDQALLLTAAEAFVDKTGETPVNRRPGDRWMIYGPLDYVPDVQVEVIERRSAIPLDDNEGIYVRDIRTGRVRAVIGQSYMLKPNEELWEKDLEKAVEDLIKVDALSDRATHGRGGPGSAPQRRNKTRVITYRVPHNAAVQIYDYRDKKARVVFGPDLVMLGPDEHFTVLSLSGGKPKKPNTIRSLCLLLGPDFMTDIVKVETSDHARLQLQLSYNWEFRVDKTSKEDATRLFQVPDFVGDTCKAVASRVRGAVASTAFDEFHRRSARIIRAAVFGTSPEGKIHDTFRFESNGLVLTNIDIQAVEPVDQRTRDSLQKSVQLAIEITTKAQEAAARHEAETTEQAARGRLERAKIADEAAAEKEREKLLKLLATSAEVESKGRATSDAKARAAAREIDGESAVERARLKAEASRIEAQQELEQMQAMQLAEMEHAKATVDLEIAKSKDLAGIEAQKFAKTVQAIGPETIRAIAQAGPEMQAKLLQGLGLKGYMITNGSSPVNLFSTASGLLGGNGFTPGMPSGGVGMPDDVSISE